MFEKVILLIVLVSCCVQVRSNLIQRDENTSILRGMIQRLHDAALEGAQKLREVLNGENIRNELKNLGLISRSIAKSILTRFADLLHKLENKVRPPRSNRANEDDRDIGILIVTMSEESRLIMTRIENMVDEANKRSKDELINLLKSKELNDLIEKLPQKLGDYVRRALNEFVGNNNNAVSYDSLSSDRLFRDLWSRILGKHSLGNEYLEKFLKGQGYIDVYNSLSTEQKKEIDELVKDLLVTSNKQIAVSFDSLSTAAIFRDLWSRILAKHATGLEQLKQFVNSQGYEDTYNSLSVEEKKEIDELLNYFLGEQVMAVSFDARSDSRVFRDLWSRILAKHAKGLTELEGFVSSQGYLDTYHSLTKDEKNEIDELLKNLMNKQVMAFSFDSRSDARVFRDLWSRILAKHSKGLTELEGFVNSQGYVDTYRSLTSDEKNEIDELLKNLMRKSQKSTDK